VILHFSTEIPWAITMIVIANRLKKKAMGSMGFTQPVNLVASS
jgi:hypothetical protein